MLANKVTTPRINSSGEIDIDAQSAIATTKVKVLNSDGGGVIFEVDGDILCGLINGVDPSAIHEVMMQDGASNPPVPMWNEAGTDWLYTDDV